MNKQQIQHAFADRREAERAFAAFIPIYLAARANRERKRRSQEARAPHPNFRDSRPRSWIPRMDLCDDPSTSQIVAVLELPGMRKEDIRLEMQNGSLVISGERRSPSNMDDTPLPHDFNISTLSQPPQTAPEVQVTPATPTHFSSDTDTVSGGPALVQTGGDSHMKELQPSLKPKSISVSRYPIQELKYGKFERTIRLPFGIEAQPNVVTATMHDGMLTVSWPRRMQSEPCQRIEIN